MLNYGVNHYNEKMTHSKIIAWLEHHDITEDMLDPVIMDTAMRWLSIKGSPDIVEQAQEITSIKNMWGLDSQVNYLTNFFGAEALAYEKLLEGLGLPPI